NSSMNGYLAACSRLIFAEQETKRNHEKSCTTQDEIDVLIGEGVRLLLQLVVNLPLCHVVGICRPCTSGKDVAERIDTVLHVWAARTEVLEHMILVELAQFCHTCVCE